MCQRRGTTLEEGWISLTVLAKQIHMCLRNAEEYWPPDRIPEAFKRNLFPADIWEYICRSFNYHREQVASLPITQLRGLPHPGGVLGVFLGHCAHAVTVTGILIDEERIVFDDPWQSGKTPSLLSEAQNTVGIKAVRIDEHIWSITKQEFIDSVLSYMMPKLSYDYFLPRT